MEFNDNKPIYLQLADEIMREVALLSRHDGQRLPSVREYAAKTGVNPNTVVRTYGYLQNEGVIYNQRGVGYFYAQDASERILAIRRKEMMEKEIYYIMDRLLEARITPEKFNDIYSEYIRNKPGSGQIPAALKDPS